MTLATTVLGAADPIEYLDDDLVVNPGIEGHWHELVARGTVARTMRDGGKWLLGARRLGGRFIVSKSVLARYLDDERESIPA